MIQDMIRVMKSDPATLLEDTLGLGAVMVLVLGCLYLPGSF